MPQDQCENKIVRLDFLSRIIKLPINSQDCLFIDWKKIFCSGPVFLSGAALEFTQ
jgi:hypothetical protein